MNRHTVVDSVVARTTALELGSNVFFSDSIESPSIEEHLDAITVHVPAIDGEGPYEVCAQTLAGELDPALYVTRWAGHEYPALIWHHGNTERPFDFRHCGRNVFNRIIGGSHVPEKMNIIVLRAAFHDGPAKDYAQNMRDLKNLAAMQAVSVKLVEHLTGVFSADVAVSGISLGGCVTNMHRAFYNTAKAYIPLLAGASPEDLFLNGAYRGMTSQNALNNPEKIVAAINFEEAFTDIADDNVFPLLAKFDRFVRYERVRPVYGDREVVVLDKGHITAAKAGDELREHIFNSLPFDITLNKTV